MKLKLAISILLLVGTAVAMTNIVVLLFWAGDILSREAGRLEQQLTFLRAVPEPERSRAQSVMQRGLDLASSEGCIAWQGSNALPAHGPTPCLAGLRPLVESAAQTGQSRLSRGMSLTTMFGAGFLYVAVPYTEGREGVQALGVGVPTARFLQPLWQKERVIAAYLLFNAIVLAVLAFFRLFHSHVRPIDHLVRATEQYRGEGMHAFGSDSAANEVGQLAQSIRAMILRIEAEKHKLAETARELAESNRQLRENQTEMVRAEKLASVGRLAAGLAHEIGNPLGVAQGYLQLMAMEGSEPAEIADYAGRAGKELARVDGLIRQLLDFARSGRSRRERFDLHGLLAEMADSLRLQPFLEGIVLTFACAAAPSTVFADPEQLRQVVLNCLINSADAIRARTPAEGGLIRLVTATATEAGQDMLQLNIIDNGEGIEPAMIGAVFDPFFTTKEPGAGTGLGLSVSLSLIESMGGRMRLASAQGEGATVTLLLPVDEAGSENAADGPVEAIHA